MINKKMEKMLNDQFVRELYSANLYLSICSYFESIELDGFANFFRLQAQEEMAHAMKQFDYLHQVDGKMTITAIAAPPNEFESIQQAFDISLSHEEEVTKRIHAIVKASIDESDFPTHAFLQWFVSEQVEEEALIRNIISKLKMIGDNKGALYLLNDELSRRKPDPTAAGAL